MCSSKIIRKLEERTLASYTLAPLGGALPQLGADPFRPVRLGSEEPEASESGEAEAAAPPPGIPEEEALRMVGQARAEGVQEGRAQAEAELAAVTEALGQALLATGSLRAQLMHESEEDLLRLSVLIARKVMLREFACDPGILAGLVHGALELACGSGEVVVKLNPDEYLVVADCPEFQKLLAENRGIVIKGDPTVGRAGCLVETVRGNIDAGVDAQLDDILRRLTEEKSARHEEESGD